MKSGILPENLSHLNQNLVSILNSCGEIGQLEKTKTEDPTLIIDGIFFHTKYDPRVEAFRLIDGLKKSPEKKLYIFFGAGLGYTIQEALKHENCQVIWMECYPEILKQALSLYDYSSYLKKDQLKILVKPFQEDLLYEAFKGMAVLPVTFIPHRPSLSWKESEYIELKYICEKFFKKKDVNIATLSRFEKIWTRNMIQNIPELCGFVPVAKLFGIANGLPILVTGAGPSLFYDLESIRKYRENFLLIAVDTALHILTGAGIDPDLIYSVDPQALNTSYLEGYEGNAALVFDPTSSYHSLRLPGIFQKGFFTSSPFPLLNIFTKHLNTEAGDIPFGGSVSTNAVSLAELMGASNVYFAGQDLAFTGGYAHCRGAILEERLNFKETRYFRREKHNYRQLTALPKLIAKGYNGEEYHTNEKMQIFLKWFSGRAEGRNWINLTTEGSMIPGVPKKTFKECFSATNSDTLLNIKESKLKIKDLLLESGFLNKEELTKGIQEVINELSRFSFLLKKGKDLSSKIYDTIKRKGSSAKEIPGYIREMDSIDEAVSGKKGINEIIGTSVQRIILTITEGYESNLTVEEKKNEHLSIAKKSLLLYEGLYDGAELNRKLLKKSLYRLKH